MANKAMKLIDNYGTMECRCCGSRHSASFKPGGGFCRGVWQCSDEQCPTNKKIWDDKKGSFVKARFLPPGTN